MFNPKSLSAKAKDLDCPAAVKSNKKYILSSTSIISVAFYYKEPLNLDSADEFSELEINS